LGCEQGEAYLAALHPGVSAEDVLANTGWNLRVARDFSETPKPTDAELRAIRDYDKKGFWTS
jgi:glutaconate CoA-transferase subunit B